MAEEAACGVVANMVVNVVTLIGRQLRYVFCYKGNIKKMKIEVGRLEARRSEVEILVEAATNNCEVVGPSVVEWLKLVEEEKNEVDLVLSEIEKIGKGCLNEWCLHLKSRYWLSRKTTKRTLDLVNLLAQGDFPTVAYPPPPLGMVPTSSDNNGQIELVVLEGQEDGNLGTTSNPASVMGSGIASTSTGIFGELKSRSAILEYVMEAVRDVNIHTIGVCGMGGIGKTTLIKEVAKRAKEKVLFDEIVFVVVSQNPDMKSIQLGIAELLGLELKQDSSLARARRLHERLNQKGSDGKPKRILVLLDDLWNKLDLEEVGIRYPDDCNGCKILLTSRSMDVCHQMKAAPFHIESLREEEAWSLFQNSLHPTNSYPIGKAIVAECRGLPMAITTIAALLANKEENTWNHILRKLETSSLQGPYKKVYTVFQVSYDNLEPQEVKDVFLLCCLFPEDSYIPIEDIARYGMGLKVFKKIDTLNEARDAAHVHIEALKKLNLLLDSEEPDSVKMHDLVRDFGISIASEDKFLVRFDSGLKRWPVEDTKDECTHISMLCDGINELPNGLKYSNLKLLQLMCTYVKYPFKFPERLDEVTGRLQVLYLLRMRVPSILESVKCLTNLRTLSLTQCELKGKVPGIGNLMQLEILSFAYSTISELPIQVGKLSRLRLLDLTGCYMLQKMTPGILLGLTFLEELYMRGTKIRWAEEDDEDIDEESHASFAELERLCNLVAIEIDIPYQFLPTKVNLESLEKFMITFGGENDLRLGFENSLSLEGDEIVRFEGLLTALCKKTKFLHVSVKNLVNLRNEVEGKDLSRLNTLIFEDCDELACVFDGPDQSFNIRSSSLLLRPFGNLRELTLTRCGNLKSVCPPSIARGFVNLEILEISKCSSIEEIISYEAVGDEDEQKSIIGPEMKILGSSDSQHASSTEHPLFHQKVTLNEGRGVVALSPRKGPHIISQGFQNLKELEVVHCNRLNTIFSLSIARGMVMLERLTVASCESMEAIFSEETRGEDEEQSSSVVTNKIEFPKLKTLDLKNMPNLVEFCRFVNVVSLPQLENLYLSDLPKLHSLCIGMKTLVSGQPFFDQKGFQNLKMIEVRRCDSLKRILPLSITKGMDMLERLTVASCGLMEEIFSEETRGEDEGSSVLTNKIEFPKLKKLHIENMPNMVEFCRFVNLVSLPQLENIYLLDLPKLHSLCIGMKTLVSSQPFFDQKGCQNLKMIEVGRCDSLKRILPLSVTRGMDMLEEVIVEFCDMMEEIFLETSIAVVASKITFPKLKKLELKALPNLVSFCRSVHLVTVPQLIWLHLIDVPKLHGVFNGMKSLVSDHKVLSQGEHQLHNLDRVTVERNHVVEVVFDLEAFNINESHDEHKALPRLRWVYLRELPKLRDVWRKVPPHIQGFYNLNRLVVEECSSLRYLLTTSMAKALVGLKYLEVYECNNLESIVSEEEENESAIQQLVLFPQLDSLTLKDLPKLSTIAPKMYTLKPKHLILSCVGDFSRGDILQQVLVTNLRGLYVKECNSLRYLLTTSMAKALVRLTSLEVSKCNNLESIVSEEEENESAIQQLVLFPQLYSLTLTDLPKLSTIAPKTYTLKPKVLKISCVGDFTLGHVLQQVLVTDLVELHIKGVMEKMITVFQQIEIPQLSDVAIEDCAELEVVFDFRGLNLNEGHHQAKAFSQLKCITLKRLPKLTSLCKNAPNVIQGFQNLDRLEIVDCDSLRHLFTPSQAKTLVSLMILKVTSCKSLEAIVIEEEGEKEEDAEEVILFPHLKVIRLKNLPSLLTGLPNPYTFKSTISCVSVEERLAYLLRLEELSD